jgi:hypothetical protein
MTVQSVPATEAAWQTGDCEIRDLGDVYVLMSLLLRSELAIVPSCAVRGEGIVGEAHSFLRRGRHNYLLIPVVHVLPSKGR